MAAGRHPGWAWRPVARDPLLARGFHSCTVLRDRFYVVGGLSRGDTREPLGEAVTFDPATGETARVGGPGGPRRSHHDAAAVGGRWLCVVGGWDGARRVAAVAALDAERGAWEAWAAAPGGGGPAGLSGHTCTRLRDGELRVAGREGGARTQRRFGSVFGLRLDPAARAYSYRPEGLHTASRSGHCAALLRTGGPRPGHRLLLFGGCSAPEPDEAGRWGPGHIQEEPAPAPRLTQQLSRLVSGGQGSPRGPPGLRYHSCTVVGPFAVLFGGETLTRARDAVCDDLYIYDSREHGPGAAGPGRQAGRTAQRRGCTALPGLSEPPSPRQGHAAVVPLPRCRQKHETRGPPHLPVGRPALPSGGLRPGRQDSQSGGVHAGAALSQEQRTSWW
ncbi:kelch domain-containing protein 9 isoform X2 [Macrotis lagotis]|uniref:kelch domain-containing protein 9 isoform X2 n=1 Tax=Macrotis lagotis TaxID=92651 RepID=UPI003D685A46